MAYVHREIRAKDCHFMFVESAVLFVLNSNYIQKIPDI